MSESSKKMTSALREVVVPILRDMGFRGSFPHFRRLRDEQLDLLTFQFSSWGGQFCVEIGYCPPAGHTISDGEHVPPDRVRLYHLGRERMRLGYQSPQSPDHWFSFEPESDTIYQSKAQEVLALLASQAMPYWLTREKKPPTVL